MTCGILTIEKPNTPTYSRLLSLGEQCQHPHFWFHDGDTIISAENVYFRIHRARVIPLSKTLPLIFKQLPDLADSQGLYFLREAKGGHLAWACLLGLIYSKEKAAANPSFRELLAVTRVTMIYDFVRIHAWALACMRRNFFTNPEHMQVDTKETIEERLVYAVEVFQAWWFPRQDLNNRTLAIYALARLDPDLPWMHRFRQRVQPKMWQIIVAARKAMEARYTEITSHISDIALRNRESDAHCPNTCQRWLLLWMRWARERDCDALKVLRQLPSETPLGPVCQECINDVHTFLSKAYRETSCSLPVYTGCHGQKVESWDINPVFMDTNLLLSCP